MSNKSNNNGTNMNASNEYVSPKSDYYLAEHEVIRKTPNKTPKSKGRKGPRPIKTVAQLREELLKTMMVKELRKIDRKIGKLIKREVQLKDKLYDTQTALDNLKIMRTEYAAEVGG